jgi:anthranilate synthase
MFKMKTILLWLVAIDVVASFSPAWKLKKLPFLTMSSSPSSTAPTTPNFNSVEVAKTGGRGVKSASQQALDKNLSLGAPPARPKGGHFLTKGGIQVTSHVNPIEFSKSPKEGTSEMAIEYLVDKLDSHKGVLLKSSYEFPGRYARWSLGFIDPPIEVTGRADKCTIRALNARGKILMPAIEQAMRQLKSDQILQDIQVFKDTSTNGVAPQTVKVDVTVVPQPEVGTFSEEQRSRQVRACMCSVRCRWCGLFSSLRHTQVASLIFCQDEPLTLFLSLDDCSI